MARTGEEKSTASVEEQTRSQNATERVWSMTMMEDDDDDDDEDEMQMMMTNDDSNE